MEMSQRTRTHPSHGHVDMRLINLASDQSSSKRLTSEQGWSRHLEVHSADEGFSGRERAEPVRSQR